MKTLFITNAVDGTGAYARLKAMGRALVEAGHVVFWLAPGIKDEHTGFHLLKYDLQRRGHVYKVLHEVQSAIECVDLCVCISELDALKLLRCKQLRKARKIFFQRIDIYAGFRFYARSGSSAVKRFYFRVKAWLYLYLSRYVARRIDTLVFQTQKLRDDYLARVGRVKAGMEILPNNCDSEWDGHSRYNAHCPWKTEGLAVVMVMSNMYYHGKGIDIVLDAFDLASEKVPIRLALVGKVPPQCEHILLRRIRNSPYAENIMLLGFVANAKELLRYAMVFCAPAYLEACSNSVLEAMAVGIPILASDIDGHRILLEDKRLLFKTGDPSDLASELSLLIQNKQVRDMNAAIVRKQAKKFSFDWEAEFVEMCERIAHRPEDTVNSQGGEWTSQEQRSRD